MSNELKALREEIALLRERIAVLEARPHQMPSPLWQQVPGTTWRPEVPYVGDAPGWWLNGPIAISAMPADISKVVSENLWELYSRVEAPAALSAPPNPPSKEMT